MAFLLDTNVVSESVRPRPRQPVLDWIEAQNPVDLFLAAQTIGELVRGARKVKEQERRKQFERWIEQDLARQFDGRVLPFDGRAAAVWDASWETAIVPDARQPQPMPRSLR